MKIKNVRVSPYALKRKHLVELLIIKEKNEDQDMNEIVEKSRLFQESKYDKGLYYCKKCYCSFKSKEKF